MSHTLHVALTAAMSNWPILFPDERQKGKVHTGFSGDLYKGLHAALSVVALRCERGHVVPLHRRDDVHHGLCLVGIWRHHAGEEVVASVVTQFWSRGGVADLGDLDKGRRGEREDIEIKMTEGGLLIK